MTRARRRAVAFASAGGSAAITFALAASSCQALIGNATDEAAGVFRELGMPFVVPILSLVVAVVAGIATDWFLRLEEPPRHSD